MPTGETYTLPLQQPYPGERLAPDYPAGSVLNTEGTKEERISVSRMRELSLIAGELVERAESLGVKRHEFCLLGRFCQQYAER